MSQPTAESQPPPVQPSGHRDMMFCHECHDEWYRDEHGLTCPECGSDFTEIIEEGNDPRDQRMFDDDDDESLPDLEAISPEMRPLVAALRASQTHNHHDHDHNHDDPEEGDISNLQFRQVGPGRFSVTGTMFRTVSPGRGGSSPGGAAANTGSGPFGGLGAILTNLIAGGGAAQQNQNQTTSGNQDNLGGQGQGGQAPEGASGPPPGGFPGGGPGPHIHRFTYTAGARLAPRDANHPGPRIEPVDELNNVLVGLMAAFGEPPGRHHHEHFHGPPPPINPLVQILSQMLPGNGQFGDAVYSQEALDRIITQLMEQNASSNAPGPASQKDIDSLPRRKVGMEDLGAEGHAECSICMEEVDIGEEVAELPCHHWFHHGCIAAWLGEHDTCPHCRKGITKGTETSGAPANEGQDRAGNGNGNGNGGEGPGSSSTRSMPGAFVTGEGSSENPYGVSGSPAATPHHEGNPADNSSVRGEAGAPAAPAAPAAEESNAGEGISERLRRGLFGPPR